MSNSGLRSVECFDDYDEHEKQLYLEDSLDWYFNEAEKQYEKAFDLIDELDLPEEIFEVYEQAYDEIRRAKDLPESWLPRVDEFRDLVKKLKNQKVDDCMEESLLWAGDYYHLVMSVGEETRDLLWFGPA